MEVTERIARLKRQVASLRRSSSAPLFPEELRKEAVLLAAVVGVRQLTSETGILDASIYQWRKLYPGLTTSENSSSETTLSVTRVVIDQKERQQLVARLSIGSVTLDIFQEQVAIAISESIFARGAS